MSSNVKLILQADRLVDRLQQSLVAQVVRHLPFTAEGRLRSQARPCGICFRRRWGGGTGFFLPALQLFCQYHSTNSPHFSCPLSLSFHHCSIHIHPSSTDATDSVFAEKKTRLSRVTCSFNVGEKESGRFRLGAAAAQRVHWCRDYCIAAILTLKTTQTCAEIFTLPKGLELMLA